jgi:anti-sigma regulatory factor (Ser/Thr protein kinase)
MTTELDAPAFHHEAVLYAGDDAFVAVVEPFVRAGLEADERVVVVVRGEKIAPVRDALGRDAGEVQFADMREVGRNPARLLQAWNDILAVLPAGAAVRGVGEPVYAGRSAPEIAECHAHESVINAALAQHALTVICPYDTAALEPTVIDEVRRTHPLVSRDAPAEPSAQYTPPERWRPGPLAPPPAGIERHAFDVTSMHRVRRLIADAAAALGFREQRSDDAIIAVNEAMTNSVIHGGGRGTIACWSEGSTLVCEVHDLGHVDDPYVGRHRPPSAQTAGHGLWIVNQLCDLAQLRSDETGTTLRMRIDKH